MIFTKVIMNGNTLSEIPPIEINASGAPKSAIGPNDTPCNTSKWDKKLYAAIKNGISSKREIEPFKIETIEKEQQNDYKKRKPFE